MIEKFNFYDIYGYFLPGLLFIALAWAPVGLLFAAWPKAELGPAIALIILAYLLGHMIQSFAAKFIPSKIADRAGRLRHPSDLVLDAVDRAFPAETVAKISWLSRTYFHLPLQADAAAGIVLDAATATRNRDHAFFLARSALLRDKKSSYWEQFEGLYALMRGATAALSAASAYFLGWCAALFLKARGLPENSNAIAGWIAFFLLLLAFLHSVASATAPPATAEPEAPDQEASARFSRQVLCVSVLLLAFLAGGLMALNGSRPPAAAEKSSSWFGAVTIVMHASAAEKDSGFKVGFNQAFLMLLLALIAALTATRCYELYKSFARQFAIAIWRDFSTVDFPTAPWPDDLHV